MNVYLTPSPKFGRGIQRVARALAATIPAGHQVVGSPVGADLWIHHVIGVQNFHPRETIDQLVQYPGRHAVVQYCLRTTENPDLIWWDDHVWSRCKVVWSYYDLPGLLADPDGPDMPQAQADPRFYIAPLGVDPIFHAEIRDRARRPIFLAGTSGTIPETEGVREVVAAAKAVGGRVLHLGPSSLALGDHVSYVDGIPDVQLAALYRNCRFVAGLRRIEGFELPAAEGLCAGATPILFDQPHYRRWFEDAGVYVPEASPEVVTLALTDIFDQEAGGTDYRVDAVDIALAQRKFSWPRVCKGFWERVLA